jgi:hypothetical protein
MLLSEVSFVLTESILTSIDGHFECFSFKGQKNYAYLEPSSSITNKDYDDLKGRFNPGFKKPGASWGVHIG